MNEPKENIGMIHKKCADERQDHYQDIHGHRILEVGDYAKIAVRAGDRNEYLWFEIVEVNLKRKAYMGRCDNEPIVTTEVSYDDRYGFLQINIVEAIINKSNEHLT